ncbi:hypothetical protein [Bacillus sp. MMSF_3328]|uniref:hypothetical protein n=1 Tax=Bacillus sp. MMSF_3328 TaxID=3047080 RepID=UPI00273DA26E|nr:hypothetical protein [Bacillus sp. MMSF_3328]
MNERLVDIIIREIVSGLPPEDRDLYQYVTNIEDRLAQQSETSDQFMSLLVKHSPLKQAAEKFSLGVTETYQRMQMIEREINKLVEERRTRMKWIDLTDRLDADGQRQLFLFIS